MTWDREVQGKVVREAALLQPMKAHVQSQLGGLHLSIFVVCHPSSCLFLISQQLSCKSSHEMLAECRCNDWKTIVFGVLSARSWTNRRDFDMIRMKNHREIEELRNEIA